MSDRELLELAAKAAGFKKFDCGENGFYASNSSNWSPEFANWVKWNPLADDGDAFRLAVMCGICIQSKCFDEYDKLFSAAYLFDDCGVEVVSVREPYTDDSLSATRRAIVRAAAIAKTGGNV